MPTILVIEDEHLARFPWRHHLGKSGYDCDLAVDGFDGVESVDADRHAMVFSDLIMPHWDGIEVVRKIRRCGLRLPVVIMVPRLDPTVITRCRNAGANGVVPKPVSQRTIQQTIRELVGEIHEERLGIGDRTRRRERQARDMRLAALRGS